MHWRKVGINQLNITNKKVSKGCWIGKIWGTDIRVSYPGTRKLKSNTVLLLNSPELTCKLWTSLKIELKTEVPKCQRNGRCTTLTETSWLHWRKNGQKTQTVITQIQPWGIFRGFFHTGDKLPQKWHIMTFYLKLVLSMLWPSSDLTLNIPIETTIC